MATDRFPQLALARRYEHRFWRGFHAEVESVRGRISQADIEHALKTQEARLLYAAVDAVPVVKTLTDEPEANFYAQLIADAGQMELRLNGHRTMASAFQVTSPFVLQDAKRQAANMVTAVSGETKRSIRQIIFEAIRDGAAPAKASRLIRQTVGLTRAHALAVARFARSNSERGTERYARRLLNLRARNIARTETIRASRAGQQLAWKEMARNHLIDTSRFAQRWMVTDDDRLCDLCAPMQDMVVPLDGSFESSERGVLPSERVAYAGETVDGPPLHPSCRCVLVADFG